MPLIAFDETLISRVLINLITNAVKYSYPDSSLEIAIRPQKKMVKFSIKDYGTGIPPELQETIFEKFVQLTDDQGRAIRRGVGLGLAFCKLAIEAHGGMIWVESQPNQGSTFFFTLPISPDQE